MQAHYPVLAGFLLVMMRCASLCSVAPLFGTKTVPVRIRVGLAAALAFAIFNGAGSPKFAAWDNTGALLGAAVVETMIGLCGGLAARMAIDAASAAGHAMSLSMGLGFGAVVDPIHGAESNAISELLAIVALGVAVAAGLHREAIVWLCRSVMSTPPGSTVTLRDLAATVVTAGAHSGALAVRLAFPVMTAVTFGHIALGIIGRATPQLNLSNVGFSVSILAGGGALYLVAPGVAEIAASAARTAFASH